MSKNLTSDIIENDKFNYNSKESDYNDLSLDLKIKSIIALLEKTTFK